jgi:hypothetical protein
VAVGSELRETLGSWVVESLAEVSWVAGLLWAQAVVADTVVVVVAEAVGVFPLDRLAD